MKPQNGTNTEQLIQVLSFLKGETSEQQLTPVKKHSSHQHCMICSPSTLLGLKLNFYSDQQQHIWSYYQSSSHQEGYQGILHGGFIAALIDGSMCQVLFNQDIEAVTADINIRFLHEIPINSEVLMTAKIISATPPLYKVQAELYVENKLMAKGSARFFKKQR